MRCVVAPVMLAVTIASCIWHDEEGVRTFDLDVVPYDPVEALAPTVLPEEWAKVEFEIVEAPAVVIAGGDDFPLVLEMYNPLTEEIPMSPCPVWEAGVGEADEVSSVEGRLPCDDIESLRAGERVELRMDMPPTQFAVEDQEGDGRVSLGWRLKGTLFQETATSVRLAMKGAE